QDLRGFGIRGPRWIGGTGAWGGACGVRFNQCSAALLASGLPGGRSSVGQSSEEQKTLPKKLPARRMTMGETQGLSFYATSQSQLALPVAALLVPGALRRFERCQRWSRA